MNPNDIFDKDLGSNDKPKPELELKQKNEDEINELLNTKLTKEQITFALDVMYKEAKYDKIQIKHVNCGFLSTFTKIPMPMNINSLHSGAGKSYLLNTVAAYYPKKYIIILNAASNKSFHHRPGKMVIKNEETGELEDVAPKIDALEDEISDLEYKLQKATNESNIDVKDIKKQIREKAHEIKDIEQKQKKLIDLSNKIIIIQDTPQESLFDNLMSLMSQDSNNDEQEYNFADTSGKSIISRTNILRGMPVLFTTRVIDDSNNARFEEKTRRFVNITPNVSSDKIREANRIKSINLGSIPSEYDQSVVSKRDKDEARRIISIIIEKVINHSKDLEPKQSGTYVLFKESITDAIPSDDVWAMTVQDRLFRYLSINTKIHMDHRPRLVDKNTGAFYPISTFEDLKETLELMEMGASNVRSYLAVAYNQVFLPAFKAAKSKGVRKLERERYDGTTYVIAEETRTGCTTEELADTIHKELGIPTPSIKEMREKYLYPLSNQGLINYSKSILNGKENIWYAVDENQNVFSLFADNDELKLKVKNPDLYPTIDVLEESIGFLLRQNVEGSDLKNNNKKSVLDDYRLLDADGKEISTHELIEKYFQHPEICFVNVPAPCLIFTENHKKVSGFLSTKNAKKLPLNDELKHSYGCYACKEFDLAADKEAYKKHCRDTHSDGKITTRTMSMRDIGQERMPLIRLPCPFCDFIDVTPTKMEDHIGTIHPQRVFSQR